MKIQLNIFAIFILAFSNLQAQPQKQNIQPVYFGERLNFSMKYLNMKVANLEFSVSDSIKNLSQPQHQLSIKAYSTPFATKLFKINNSYTTLFFSDNFLPLKSTKKIDQKNIQQKVVLDFDHQNYQATFNDSISWFLPSPCYDYFSMLYFLRSYPWEKHDTLSFFLDSEYLISKVEAILLQESEILKVPCGKFSTIKIQLNFKSTTKVKRPWKTDILTNRLAKPGSKLNIWLSNDRQRLPLKIFYLQSFVKTSITLVSYSGRHQD
jgi:hypothetical protein